MARRKKQDTNGDRVVEKKVSYTDFLNVVEQVPATPVSGWTPRAILSAIDELDSGQFSMPELLYHAMTKHPRIYQGLSFRAGAILNLPFSLEVPPTAPPIVEKKAKLFEREYFNSVLTPGVLNEIAQRLILFDFCICRWHLVAVEDQLLPRIGVWTNSNSWWNPTERAFYSTVYNEGPIKITGDPFFVITRTDNRPWLTGLMRPLARPFAFSSLSYDQWNHFNDVEATAIKKLVTPSEKREQEENRRQIAKIDSARGGSTIDLPVGYDFKLETSNGRGSAYKTFEEMVNSSNADISILFFGSNLGQEIKGGSLAATKEVYSRFAAYTKMDVAAIARSLYDVISRVWIEKNFTPSLYGRTTLIPDRPVPVFNTEPVEDPSKKAQEAKDYSEAVSKFLSAASAANVDFSTIPINWEDTAKKCGIVLSDGTPQKVVVDGDE